MGKKLAYTRAIILGLIPGVGSIDAALLVHKYYKEVARLQADLAGSCTPAERQRLEEELKRCEITKQDLKKAHEEAVQKIEAAHDIKVKQLQTELDQKNIELQTEVKASEETLLVNNEAREQAANTIRELKVKVAAVEGSLKAAVEESERLKRENAAFIQQVGKLQAEILAEAEARRVAEAAARRAAEELAEARKDHKQDFTEQAGFINDLQRKLAAAIEQHINLDARSKKDAEALKHERQGRAAVHKVLVDIAAALDDPEFSSRVRTYGMFNTVPLTVDSLEYIRQELMPSLGGALHRVSKEAGRKMATQVIEAFQELLKNDDGELDFPVVCAEIEKLIFAAFQREMPHIKDQSKRDVKEEIGRVEVVRNMRKEIKQQVSEFEEDLMPGAGKPFSGPHSSLFVEQSHEIPELRQGLSMENSV